MARLVIGTNKASNAAAIVKPTPMVMPLSLRLSKTLDGKIVRPGILIDFDDTTDVGSNGLAYIYWHTSALSGAIDLSNFTRISGERGCAYTFAGCTGITSVDFSSVTIFSGYYCCSNMFYECSYLRSVDLSSLITISNSYTCYNMFASCTRLADVDISSLTTISASYGCSYMFYGCTSLLSIDLSSLKTISGSSGGYYMFTACSNLASVDLSSLTTLTGANALKETFRGCTHLTTLSFPSLTSTSFGSSYTNQFNMMLYSVSGCTVHFPSNLQSVIGSWSDVLDGFRGTNTIVLFDLPATS